jgi:catechol 2,3-dioxygenase-like lactoylglutathione lyase family enzyme
MLVIALDHLVLTVAEIDATCRFYESALGMEATTFGEGRTALSFGHQKINLHLAGSEFSPHALRPTPGSADLCFLTELPIANVIEHLRAQEIEILDGPVQRTGCEGSLLSIYIRDPDGNLIELSNLLDHA